jgi:hypothetical protein
MQPGTSIPPDHSDRFKGLGPVEDCWLLDRARVAIQPAVTALGLERILRVCAEWWTTDKSDAFEYRVYPLRDDAWRCLRISIGFTMTRIRSPSEIHATSVRT